MDEPSQNRKTSARRTPHLVKPANFQKFVYATKELNIFQAIIDELPPVSVKKIK